MEVKDIRVKNITDLFEYFVKDEEIPLLMVKDSHLIFDFMYTFFQEEISNTMQSIAKDSKKETFCIINSDKRVIIFQYFAQDKNYALMSFLKSNRKELESYLKHYDLDIEQFNLFEE